MSNEKKEFIDNLRNQTKLVRGGLQRSQHGETSEAIFMNSGYVFKNAEEAEARFAGEKEGYLYSRYGNPTVTMFEKRMALNENAESCFATSSGMSAVFASLMCGLKAGDEVVASRALFGSCFHIIDQILPRYGIITKLIDGTDHNQWEQLFQDADALEADLNNELSDLEKVLLRGLSGNIPALRHQLNSPLDTQDGCPSNFLTGAFLQKLEFHQYAVTSYKRGLPTHLAAKRHLETPTRPK